MKIALIASDGGHLTQIQTLFTKEVLGGNESLIITNRNKKTEEIPGKKYLFGDDPGYNPFKYPKFIMACYKILKKEGVSLVITTGAEIGLCSMIAAKMLGIKTVFIETIIRVKTPTWAGRLSYPFADVFLVQNKDMKKYYGRRAIYRGGII